LPGKTLFVGTVFTKEDTRMDEIVQSLGTPQMIAALEANMEEEMICFGRGLAGGEIYNDGEVEGFFTGRGYLNGILRTHLQKQEKEYVEMKIKQVLRYFQDKGMREIGWSVGTDCQPANMLDYLKRHGFQEQREANVGMALNMTEMQVEINRVADLVINEIEEPAGLTVIKQLEMACFGSSEELAQNYCEMYTGVGFGQGTAWRHFSGWWQGKPVASTSLLFHAGVAGIFGVATAPEARRQGIARAMVLHAIEQARRAGYRIAILSPTEMSEGIYRRLGFRSCTKIRHFTYEW
jgi:GNAT superfamily N-acetyltransferase